MAGSAEYKCSHTTHVIDPSPYFEEPGNLVADDYPMLEPRLSNLRKRQRVERDPSQLNGKSQPLLKRQKLNHSIYEAQSQPPVAFWDNLSKLWLTKRALRELNRRNTQAAPNPPSSRRRSHRPLTRRILAELKKNSIQSASHFLDHCTAKCLKDIKRFASHGGPDLSDLRSVCTAKYFLALELTMSLQCTELVNRLDHAMSSSQSSSRVRKRASRSTSKTQTTATAATTTSKTTGPYDRAFQQNLIDHGVYPHAYDYPDGRSSVRPDNWEEITQRLAQPRPSLSPSKFSDNEFSIFTKADAHAFKEEQVRNSVSPIIEGQTRDRRCVAGGIRLTNLDHLTDGTISPGNPDLFYGARPEQLDRRIRKELNSLIVSSTQTDLPMAPNFFLAAKGPDGTAVVARGQACYDGALGARGIQSLQSYGQPEPIYDKKAYTVTSIYNDGTLKLYTSHPSQPTGPESRPAYYMNQLKGWAMTSDPSTFRQGATAYRNARDWAKEKRDGFIEAANGKMPDIYTESQSLELSGYEDVSTSTARPVLVESDTSADELALEEEQIYTSFSKRPRR